MLLTEEQLHFIQQSCWVSISHQENQVLFSHGLPQWVHLYFVSWPPLKWNGEGSAGSMYALGKRAAGQMFFFLFSKWGSRKFHVCVHVCVCECVCVQSPLQCDNRKENGSSMASNKSQMGVWAYHSDGVCLGFMTLTLRQHLHFWSVQPIISPGKRLFHVDKGLRVEFRGYNWKPWKFAFKASFLTRGCQLPFTTRSHCLYVNPVEWVFFKKQTSCSSPICFQMFYSIFVSHQNSGITFHIFTYLRQACLPIQCSWLAVLLLLHYHCSFLLFHIRPEKDSTGVIIFSIFFISQLRMKIVVLQGLIGVCGLNR